MSNCGKIKMSLQADGLVKGAVYQLQTVVDWKNNILNNALGKININSDLRFAFRKSLDEALRESPDEIAVYKLMTRVYEAVQAVVEEKMSAFGSAGKAVK